MINAIFKRACDEKAYILCCTIEGHALSGEYGKDIICAGVSALAINTVNSLELLALTKPIVKVNEELGYLYIEPVKGKTITHDDCSQILLESFCLGLTTIADEYGEYLRVENVYEK
ncbi:MAG: ribosomal-processing cysteine protease Prp [Streptococcaceae bacterium]|jgi:uncharacterized protein YsxB (DUF464 family)|nr:ribosomal-processing cysteine protease Prp [Streptococcaceae bacterium]